MKILFCLHHFFPFKVGGTEHYVLSLSKSLIAKGYEAVVVTPGFDEKEEQEYFYEGVRVIRYAETSEDDRLMIMGFRKPRGLNNFESILKKEQADVIHFQELIGGRGPNVFHVEVAKQLNAAIFLTTHLTYYTCSTGTLLFKGQEKCDGKIIVSRCSKCILAAKGTNPLLQSLLFNTGTLMYRLGINPLKQNTSFGTALGIPWLVKRKKDDWEKLSQLCDTIITPAHFYREVLRMNDTSPHKLHCITQGMNIHGNAAEANPKKDGIFRIAYFGRVTKIKGLDVLIKAMGQLHNKKVTLDIYGGYDATEGFYESCRKLADINQNIHWVGLVEANDVVHSMRTYDVICIPSFFEMSPLVIQEAFAAGVPVLASDVPGNKEQITDGVNGWLFHPGDAIELSAKIQMLMASPGIIERTKQTIPGVKSFETVATEYIRLYKSTLSKTAIA